MMNTEDMLVRYDRRFQNESFYGENGMLITYGHNPIILSAPHSVNYCKKGRIQNGEYRTGSLSLILSDICEVNSIVKIKNLGDDVNSDVDCSFKKELAKLINRQGIKYLIDLHIMAYNRPMDIDIGTAYGKSILNDFNLLQNVVNIFKRNGIENVSVDKIFTGSKPTTVISTISKECNIPCIQFEINWNLIYDKRGTFDNLYKAMVEIISELSQMSKTKK